MRLTEELIAYGHPNVTAKHPTTFEITRDPELTKRGDCVIAVRSTKGPKDLSTDFKHLCRNDETRIILELRVNGFVESIEGRGSHRLTLNHWSDMVGRTSTHISDRTVMIRADKAACDIDRDLIHTLHSSRKKVLVRITAELYGIT